MRVRATIDPMPGEARKTNLVDEVYHHIRSDLLAARFAPGQWLRLPVFTKQYGVSLSVAREALTRLSSEGVVEAIPKRGFRVIELSLAELKDLTEARVSLEVLALEASLRSGDQQWEKSLVSSHQLLERTPMRDSETNLFNREFVPVHANFHHALLSGGRNKTILRVTHELRERSELYRMWTPLSARSVRDIVEEHKQLTEFALARDLESAAKLLAFHIDHTQEALVSAPELTPGTSAKSSG